MSDQRVDALAMRHEVRGQPRGRLTGLLVLCAAAVSLLIGCGPKSDLLEISGEVTLNGSPLESGSVRLSSAKGQKPSSSGALIRDGKYLIPQKKGLLPGTYYISINAADEGAPKEKSRTASGSPGVALAREMIPAEYNVNSEKTIEVTADGDNHFVFDIVTGGSN